MSDKLYYKYKHKIEFYLKIQNITDFSKFDFNVIDNNHTEVVESEARLNVTYWGYENIEQPTIENLKYLKNNKDFIQHRVDNELILPEQFILKIILTPGNYTKGFKIFDNFSGKPYVWFTENRSGTYTNENIKTTVINSTLYLNKDLVCDAEVTYYIKCKLIPLKDLELDKKHCLKFSPTVSEQIIQPLVEVPNTNEIIEPEIVPVKKKN